MAADKHPNHRFFVGVVLNDKWHHSAEEEDEDIWTVLPQLDRLWWLFAESGRSIDSPDFYDGPDSARYYESDLEKPGRSIEIFPSSHGDARVAVANWRFAESRWWMLLTRKCFSEIQPMYPPAPVMSVLAHTWLGFSMSDHHFIRKAVDDATAIKHLEAKRLEGVAVVRPSLALFNASLVAAGFKTQRVGPKRTGPWINKNEMVEFMELNNAWGSCDESIRRKKILWQAEIQPGSGSQTYRFDLDFLDAFPLIYPPKWDDASNLE